MQLKTWGNKILPLPEPIVMRTWNYGGPWMATGQTFQVKEGTHLLEDKKNGSKEDLDKPLLLPEMTTWRLPIHFTKALRVQLHALFRCGSRPPIPIGELWLTGETKSTDSDGGSGFTVINFRCTFAMQYAAPM